MRNEAGLIKVQPGEVKNPKGRGKGSKNRGTIISKWLEANSKGTNPISKEEEHLSQEDWIILAMIGQARKGNVKAAEFLFDGKYGPLLRMAGANNGEDSENPDSNIITIEVVDPHFDNVTNLSVGASK